MSTGTSRPIITMEEAAELFRVTPTTLRSHMRQEDSELGGLFRRARKKYGRRVYFIRDVLAEAWQVNEK